MKVLSLLQPHASLCVTVDTDTGLAHKCVETRSWNTKYRGQLLIHASARWDFDLHETVGKIGADSILKEAGFKGDLKRSKSGRAIVAETNIPLGAIIGKVDLVDTFPIDAVRLMIEQNMSCYIGGNKVEFSEQELAFGDYSEGRYGWVLKNPVLFKHPIPAKGKLSIWDYEFEGNDDSHRTVAEINQILSKNGARKIIVDNDNAGNPISVTFTIDLRGTPIAFALPCNYAGVRKAMQNSRKIPAKKCTDEQALRVAWRIQKNWIEAQLAIVEAEMASTAEVFLQYAVTKTGETLKDLISKEPGKLLLTN